MTRRFVAPAIRRPRVSAPPWPRARVALLLGIALCASAASAATPSSAAYFSNSANTTAAVAAARIFPGVRTTSAFTVGDASGGGSETDRSSPFASAGDALTIETGAWDTAFAGDRYLQFDLNAPLPAGLGTSSVTLRLTWSSSSPSGTTCVYVEVRAISSDSVLDTYGDAGSPIACVTGTALTSFTQSLPVVGTTDAANDLRVRVYARDSDSAGSVIDEATVAGFTPYAPFTLYPVRFTDAAGPNRVTIPWELQGP